MKKIVALVLALVLALSLATVAFATTTTNTVGGAAMDVVSTDEWSVARVNSDSYDVYDSKSLLSGTTAWTKTVDVDGVKTVTYKPVTYTIGVDADNSMTFAEADVHSATFEIYKNDVFVTYAVQQVGNFAVDGYKAATFVAKDADNCGGYKKNALVVGSSAYQFSDNATAGKVFVIDGKLAYAGDAATKVAHVFKPSNVTYKSTSGNKDANLVPVSVKCSECDKTFAIIKLTDYRVDKYDKVLWDEAAGATESTKFANVLKTKDTTTNTMVTTYCVVDDVVAAAAGTTTTGVSSAKTFDAGVALYAGMALMSVAGSAVVIGKKKEF